MGWDVGMTLQESRQRMVRVSGDYGVLIDVQQVIFDCGCLLFSIFFRLVLQGLNV